MISNDASSNNITRNNTRLWNARICEHGKLKHVTNMRASKRERALPVKNASVPVSQCTSTSVSSFSLERIAPVT